MRTIKHVERLQQIHNLIDLECTGAPIELAHRLKVSERTIYYLLEQLKEFDARIAYDRSRKTYFYKNEFFMEVHFSISIGTEGNITEFLKGSYFNRNYSGNY